jgi:hypothetical protein
MNTWVGRIGLACLGVAAGLASGCTQPVGPEEGAAQQIAQADSVDRNGIHVTEEVDIHASPQKIWSILVDVGDYSEWNTWLTMARDTTNPSGPVQVGDNIDATVILGTGPSQATETVTVVDAPGTPGQPAGQVADFTWRDTIPITSCLVPAYRSRTMTLNADGSVHFKNDLVLQGAIDWVAWLSEQATLHTGMHDENTALRARAESGP